MNVFLVRGPVDQICGHAESREEAMDLASALNGMLDDLEVEGNDQHNNHYYAQVIPSAKGHVANCCVMGFPF